MENGFKRFLSLALAFLMVLSNVPVQAFANEDVACTDEGHTVSITDASCTKDGSSTITCPTCGNSTQVLPAAGHDFGEGAATCSVCGEANPDYKAPHQHVWGETYDITATCTEAGEGKQDCSVEGCELKTQTVTVEALGHSYVDGKCGTCGALDPVNAIAEEAGETLPNATVTVLEPLTLTAEEHAYSVWDGKTLTDGTKDLPLQIVMNFKANDTLEEAKAGGYGDWLCDFYLTFEGLAEGNITADGCYLAGNYGTYGWIAIPTDGMELDSGTEYPVVSTVQNLTYETICDSVKDFTAALYIDPAILEANPDFKVTLKLKMTDPANETNVLTIGEPAEFTAEDLLGKEEEPQPDPEETLPDATVTKLEAMTLTAGEYNVYNGSLTAGTEDLPLQIVMNFKANDTLEEAKAGSYGDWLCDFYLTFDGLKEDKLIAKGCYLAGNYGSYGWIAIPTDGLELEAGTEYPVVSTVVPNLTYETICDSVKDFTAALYIDPAILEANPDFNVTLKLKMTDPENAANVLTIGEPAVFTANDLLDEEEEPQPDPEETLPDATVTKLEAMTLTAGEYNVYNGSLTAGTEDLPLQIVMNFKANDTLEEAKAGGYGDWLCDFYLTFDGLKEDTLTANDCYLAGNYGSYGWIAIPTDGLTVEEGKEYPIVSNYDANLTYENICDYVKDFTAALYVNPETLLANPDMTVTLKLKMTSPDGTEAMTIGDAAVYTAPELYGEHKPEAEVKVLEPLALAVGEYDVWNGSNLTEGAEERPLQAVMNFKAIDSLAEAQLSGYGDWICDFYLSFDNMAGASISGDGSYLAGNYGTYGWIAIPTDDMTVEEGVEYPIVTNYDPKLTYENICDYVKEFTAALYVNPETLLANPDMTVTLKLKMTNPENSEDYLIIGEEAVYTAAELYGKHLPEAEVKVMDPLTLAAGGYDVWNGSSLSKGTEGRPLQAVMNFKAKESLAEAQLGGYGDWICDFYLTFDGLENDKFTANSCYLAGNYGSYGWIVIPTNGVDIAEGERYPVVTNYDPKLTYENICDYVRDFTAAIYVTPEILAENPDFTVTLALQMTNPQDEEDIITIGEPAVFTMEELLAACGYVAQNTVTKKLYNDVNEANSEAVEGETVILLKDVNAFLLAVYQTFDLNGYALTAQYVTSFGNIVDNSESNAGLLKVDTKCFLAQKDNAQLPVNTPDGYQFVEILKFNYAYKADQQKYGFQPVFEEYAHDLLLAGHDVSGVDICLNVSWVNDNGEPRTQGFSYNDDEFLKGYINSYKSNGKYGKMFTLTLKSIPTDLTYQIQLISDNGVTRASDTTLVEKTEEDKTTTENITINTNAEANQASALVPEGTKLADNATADSLKLTVAEVEDSQSNITLGENEVQKSVDVHIEGIAADNTVPMIITLTAFANVGLNEGNLKLYHVENGETNAMNQVSTLAEVDAHNEFYYDPTTGNVTMALATFSEVTMAYDTTAAWEGGVDHSWYDESKTELIIANADQLWSFSQIVGGMNDQTQDSFSGKTVKLIADINLGDDEDNNVEGKIFYPIGYYNSTGSYAKSSGGSVTSGFQRFEGTFDGQGHTISNFYQNTWEMFGDYNDGYSGTPNHYRDGMGLFGKVYGGTVKNLTVSNFSSDGEFTTTGVIAAYADSYSDKPATFKNIAIVDCNPRVYNIGNGGIVGCGGWYSKDTTVTDAPITFENITVDNTNIISALWGSWDVACSGIMGQYYPNSGCGVSFENCHVSAQIDVYNDVCGAYQYYAYRYAGMLIGSIRNNLPADENGHVYPDMTGISASGCTVNYGDWNDYYYCELHSNPKASYTHDHKFSRLEKISSLTEIQSGNTWTKKGNFVLIEGDTTTCYHIVTGENGVLTQHTHESAGTETIDGVEIDKEDHACVKLPFDQLFTGYGWGVTSKGLKDYYGVETDLIHVEEGQEKSDYKFDLVFQNTGDYLYRIGNLNNVKVSSLFKARTPLPEGVEINGSGVYVSITDMLDETRQMGTFTPSTTGNWEDGTIKFNETGAVKVTIQDYNFCKPTVLYLEVVEGYNVTDTMSGWSSNNNNVLIENVSLSSDGTLYLSNKTLFGNGFELDITAGNNAAGTNTNYSIFGLNNAKIDNTRIVGAVYTSYGVMANSAYSAAAIGATGNSIISNSQIANCLSPVKALSGTLTIENTTLDGGRYCNLDVRGADVILDGVTTINTTYGGTQTPETLGLGVVIYYQNSDSATVTIGEGGLTQYNWLYINETDATTGDYSYFKGDTTMKAMFQAVFLDSNSNINTFAFTKSGKTYVNTGILSLNPSVGADAEINCPDAYTGCIVRYNGNNGYLWTSKAFDSDKATNSGSAGTYVPDTQGTYDPVEKWNHPSGEYEVNGNALTISFDEGDSYTFNPNVLTATKMGKALDVKVTSEGTDYTGETITFTETGTHTFIYEYVDPYIYGTDGTVTGSKIYTVTLTVDVHAIDVGVAAPTFTFVTQSGTNGGTYAGTYSGQAGKADEVHGQIKTVEKDGQLWIMPYVQGADTTAFGSSSTNGMKGSIGVVNGIYFPIITGAIETKAGTAVSKGTIKRHYPFYGTGKDSEGSVTIVDVDTYNSSNASSKLLFYSEYDGTQGVGVGSADDFSLAQGATSSGATCSNCKWGITSGEISGGDASSSPANYGNNIDSIYYAKFSYTAANEQTYYYYVGYAFAQDTSAAKQKGCFTPDTLVTLADGSQKCADELNSEDKILSWDFFTGTYEEKEISLLVNHGEALYKIANLEFSDGTILRLIAEHGIFDYDLNKFVYITVDNMQDYVGHRFVQYNAGGDYNIVTLDKAYMTEEVTSAYSITSAGTSNAFASGMLTVAPPEDFYNWIEMDGKLHYDVEQFQKDVEEYGLYTYDVFADYVTYEQFVDWNGAYLKIPVEKGLFTFEYILELIELYAAYMPE